MLANPLPKTNQRLNLSQLMPYLKQDTHENAELQIAKTADNIMPPHVRDIMFQG